MISGMISCMISDTIWCFFLAQQVEQLFEWRRRLSNFLVLAEQKKSSVFQQNAFDVLGFLTPVCMCKSGYLSHSATGAGCERKISCTYILSRWYLIPDNRLISGMISEMMSCMILYWYKVYLGVLVPEVVALNVKWIALCLGSAIEQFILPLNTTKCVQMAMISSNEIHFICIERWIFQHVFDHIIDY